MIRQNDEGDIDLQIQVGWSKKYNQYLAYSTILPVFSAFGETPEEALASMQELLP